MAPAQSLMRLQWNVTKGFRYPEAGLGLRTPSKKVSSQPCWQDWMLHQAA
jgi:hypothetical protein